MHKVGDSFLAQGCEKGQLRVFILEVEASDTDIETLCTNFQESNEVLDLHKPRHATEEADQAKIKLAWH